VQYFYADGDQQKGPVDLEQLKTAGISPDTLVWRDGMGDWQPAGKVPELAPVFARAPLGSHHAASPHHGSVPHGSAPHSAAAQSAPQYAPAPTYAPAPQQQPPAYVPAAGPLEYQQPGYAAGGYPGYPQDMYGNYVAPPSQGLSIASMVLGILAIPSTFCYGFGFLLAVLAIIFGHVGHSQSKRQTGQANGMAVAGLICGYISLGIVLVVFLFVFMIGIAASR